MREKSSLGEVNTCWTTGSSAVLSTVFPSPSLSHPQPPGGGTVMVGGIGGHGLATVQS